MDSFHQTLAALSPEQRLEFIRTLPEAQKRTLSEFLIETQPLWNPLPGPQTEALYSEADVVFYGGSAGGGKGLLPDEVVATPYGFRQMKDLKVGDRILAGDGTMTQVIGVYPQQKQPVYKLTFADGASIVTDGPHRWNYSIARKVWKKSGRQWKVGTTDQLRTMMESGLRPMIPLCEPLKFNKSYKFDMRKLDPYLLGVWLGDGHMGNYLKSSSTTVGFTTVDQEIIDRLPAEKSLHDITYRLIGKTREHWVKQLERLGLAGTNSSTKFIPEAYKLGKVKDRWDLLQGLMDTDGTITPDGKAYYTTISKELALDVKFLVTSLGGRATLTEKTPVCTNGTNGRVEGSLAYTLYIRMPDNSRLFKLARKQELGSLSNGGRGQVKRKIVSIEPVGKSETICIAVDHPDSLFVAGHDLIVTHNTDLCIGIALTQHEKSIIFRREATQLTGIIDRMTELLGGREGFNGQEKIWRLSDRQVEFGSVPNPGDETRYQGRPHDLIVFDEISNFLEFQFRFLMGWLRTTKPGQRCRVLCAGNPPTTSDGDWVRSFWAPWLDPHHPNPAEPGELRWFYSYEGKDHPVESGDPLVFEKKSVRPATKEEIDDPLCEIITPKSRTFIPSRITDNPYLVGTGYMATLQALPEPLRSQMLYGDFTSGQEDDAWQTIPSEWVRAAQRRWNEHPAKKVLYSNEPYESSYFPQMTSMGVDVARGGTDESVIAALYDNEFFGRIEAIPGHYTPDGPSLGAEVLKLRKNYAPVHIDAIGVGVSVLDWLESQNIPVEAITGNESGHGRDSSGKFKFKNRRAELWWKFREMLDPKSGSRICLPPDGQLLADLCAPLYKINEGNVIQIESKVDLKKRLGRSPDRGDAIIYASTDTTALDKMQHFGNKVTKHKVKRANSWA